MLTYSRISYLIPSYLRFPPYIQETKLSQWNMKLDIGFYFHCSCCEKRARYMKLSDLKLIDNEKKIIT